MSVLELLRSYALFGLPAGLLLGLGLGLIANRPDGWGGYGSFRRRAARLGHIAAVMLPLIAGFYALALEAWPSSSGAALWGARLWVGGGILLVLTLFAAAWRPGWRYALPLPAGALCAGAGAFAIALIAPGGIAS